MLNTTFPAPQANSIEKVAVVVDAVKAGCDTADAVADALDVVSRQGSYYLNAAGYLGLVEFDRGQQPTRWSLTDRGAAFVELNPALRVQELTMLIGLSPDVRLYAAEGEDAVRGALETSGLSGETVGRRLDCIVQWTDAATDPERTSAIMADEQRGVASRATSAVEAQLERLAATRAQAVERPLAICQGCFMVLPATGVCDSCD